jgi:hypothetical protein
MKREEKIGENGKVKGRKRKKRKKEERKRKKEEINTGRKKGDRK